LQFSLQVASPETFGYTLTSKVALNEYESWERIQNCLRKHVKQHCRMSSRL